MKLRNVIFDFGKVLIDFRPDEITAHYVSDPTDAKLIKEAIFDSPSWERLDAGTIENEAFVAECKSKVPERLWEGVEQVYCNWIRHLPEIEGINELIRSLKADGIRVYLLSNISAYFAAHADLYPILSEMDGCVFSGVIKMFKPNADIFSYILEKFSLDPHETVFVDDRIDNIATACSFGIDGYVFDGDAKKLKAYLTKLLRD